MGRGRRTLEIAKNGYQRLKVMRRPDGGVARVRLARLLAREDGQKGSECKRRVNLIES